MDRAVIFDMDGLMIDSGPTWVSAETQFLQEFGKDYSHEIRKKYLGKRLSGVAEVLIQAYSLPLSLRDGETKLNLYLKESFQQSNISLLPGCKQLITSLLGKYKLAVASSSPREIIETVIKQVGFENYFSVVVSGEEVKNGKPAPDIFLKAADLLRTHTDHCLVLEDAPYGIVAAKNAGMKAVAVNNTSDYNLENFRNADLFVRSLEDLSEEIIASAYKN